MPQLAPAPWFAIFLTSWLIFWTVILPCILTFTFPNDPSLLDTNPMLAEPWNWPWF